MKTIRNFLIIFSVFLGAYHFVYQTDFALLSDETLLSIAAKDVLGNPLYGKSCPRSSYARNVGSLSDPKKTGTAFFKFTPVAGNEAQCPPVAVIMDRKTAEAWIE